MADIYIDGFIGQGDFFTEGYSLKRLREDINALPADTKEVNVHINSGGGDVTEGFAIYDYLNTLGYTVNTIAEGMVGSIATVIFQAGKKGKRKMHANSEFFIHNPYWTPQSPEPMEATDAAQLAESLQKAEDKILNFYIQHTTKKSKEEIKAKMAKQTSFTADEAIEWGFADEIAGGEIQNKTKYAVMAYINHSKTKNENQMDIKTELDKFEGSLINKLKNLFAPKIKAEMHETSEGVQIFYEGDLEVGKAIFLDEAMTSPAPDGVHTVDGKKVMIKEGKIESIEEAPADANAELQNEIAALKAQLAEKETALQNAATENTELKAQVEVSKVAIEEVKTEFTNFKNETLTGIEQLKGGQNFRGNEPEKTLIQKTLELRNAKK